ncbi:MAG TPA: hypothetical protein PLU58_01240 [Saprospiraceae bacterium]|nr:hypothetical protein [Saprospiraceae bacterium]
MKTLVLQCLVVIIGLTVTNCTYGQTVEFIGTKISVPKGCEKVSSYEIECGSFSLSWAYMAKGNIENILFNQISQLQKINDFDYKPIRVLIDQTPSSGFITSFTADNVKYFMLLAAGKIKGQNVLIQGIDLIPFWRYPDHNEIFDKLIRILPDDNKIKMDVEPVEPVKEVGKDE